MTDEFYRITRSLDRFPEWLEEAYDGYLEKFDGWKDLDNAFFDCVPITLEGDKGIAELEATENGVWRVLKAQMPKEMKFVVNREWLSETDFPYMGDVRSWTIMSKRMVEVLLSVGDFPHQIIPINCRDELGITLEPDYVILQLNELSNLFDLEKSVYTLEPTVLDPTKSMVRDIKKLRLVKPAGGFPPIFRVNWEETYLYVSAKAKNALEAAGIKGLDFFPNQP
jgi:hypothetical protein